MADFCRLIGRKDADFEDGMPCTNMSDVYIVDICLTFLVCTCMCVVLGSIIVVVCYILW